MKILLKNYTEYIFFLQIGYIIRVSQENHLHEKNKTGGSIMKKIIFIEEKCNYCKEVLENVIRNTELQILELEKNIELATSFSIKSVPSLVVTDANHKRAYVYMGQEGIENYFKD